jgi:hypothetical protein
MKLYTEEQVKHAIQMARASQNLFTTPFIYDKYEILEQLTPIELPTDEEVEEFINTLPFTKGLDDGQYNDGVIYGAIIGIDWMRNKIQGGNK